MKKKLFSSVLWILVGIALFGTIIKLTSENNPSTNSNTKEISVEQVTEMKQRMKQWSGTEMVWSGNLATEWEWRMFMMANVSEQLGMTQEEIEDALSDGKTMRDLMEENGLEMRWIRWATGDQTWSDIKMDRWWMWWMPQKSTIE